MAGVRIVMLGKQGAGKGTQAARVAAHYDVGHLSTGDLFRKQAEQGTAVGLEAKRYMDAGELVPDAVVIAVVAECLLPGGILSDGFVIDGFPRTLEQAMALERLLGDDPLDVVVDLDVPESIVVERMLARGRDDDTEEAIVRRLELYRAETMPIIDYYRGLGKLAEVDGVGPVDEVFDRIVKAVEAHRRARHQPSGIQNVG
jgi:adenylate kinase